MYLFASLCIDLFDSFTEKDKSRSRTSQRFVSGCRDNIWVLEWIGHTFGSDKTFNKKKL